MIIIKRFSSDTFLLLTAPILFIFMGLMEIAHCQENGAPSVAPDTQVQELMTVAPKLLPVPHPPVEQVNIYAPPPSPRIIDPPLLKSFSDSKYFVLYSDLDYSIGTTGIKVTVPKGFVTDFASIPGFLWSFGLSPKGKYTQAAIIHDFLYWTQICSREQADNILLIAMQEHKVSDLQKAEIYGAVRLFGKEAWKANREERKRASPRIIPGNMMSFKGDISWEEYRKQLIARNIVDPQLPSHAEYCELGNSAEIP